MPGSMLLIGKDCKLPDGFEGGGIHDPISCNLLSYYLHVRRELHEKKHDLGLGKKFEFNIF